MFENNSENQELDINMDVVTILNKVLVVPNITYCHLKQLSMRIYKKQIVNISLSTAAHPFMLTTNSPNNLV